MARAGIRLISSLQKGCCQVVCVTFTQVDMVIKQTSQWGTLKLCLGCSSLNATFCFLTSFTIIAYTHTLDANTLVVVNPFHCSLHPVSIKSNHQDKLFSKLAFISTTADMDKTQFTHVIKCPPNHMLLSAGHWIISQINELTKCF